MDFVFGIDLCFLGFGLGFDLHLGFDLDFDLGLYLDLDMDLELDFDWCFDLEFVLLLIWHFESLTFACLPLNF